jgi:hypothetical protein
MVRNSTLWSQHGVMVLLSDRSLGHSPQKHPVNSPYGRSPQRPAAHTRRSSHRDLHNFYTASNRMPASKNELMPFALTGNERSYATPHPSNPIYKDPPLFTALTTAEHNMLQ